MWSINIFNRYNRLFWVKRIKRIRLLRVICKPWKDKQLKQLQIRYLQSGYSEKIKKLKDNYIGKRCFIIGNGPSLRIEDLNCLKGEYTFAANRIYEIF